MAFTYNGLAFETKLLATWAAFFDLAGWQWSRGVVPVGDWVPDYRVTFECGHSECNGSHTILVSVLPVDDLEKIQGHPALSHFYGVRGHAADAGAVFGNTPRATYWQMSHGAGGGSEEVSRWCSDEVSLWRRAVSLVNTA